MVSYPLALDTFYKLHTDPRLIPGRQYFSHPSVGDLSITYTKAGGKNGDTTEGLHSPIIQLANLNNWENINVDDVIAAQGDRKTGKLCDKGGSAANQQLSWKCGLPKIGEAAFGMSNYEPGSNPSQGNYVKGWCTMHIVQYQRLQFGIGNDYAFDIVLHDAVGKQIAVKQKESVDGKTKTLQVNSALPYGIVITAAGNDQANVGFAYAGQNWACGDGTQGRNQCTLGLGEEWGYESGNRKGDMGFNC